MVKGIQKISTIGMSHEEWLSHRRNYIGGSDAAAVVGLSAYASPYTVWADKTGRTPPINDNEAMRQGRDLEDYVAKRFSEETGKKVRRENAILVNPAYPFAHANVDRVVIGEDAGLECKTASTLMMKKFADGSYPSHYYVQCMHYMAVTGASKWYLAVLIFGKEFLVFEIPRNEGEIAALVEQERHLYELIKSDTPPPVDGSPATTKAILHGKNGTQDGIVDLMGREPLLREYGRQKDAEKVAKQEAERIKQELLLALGDYSVGSCGGYTVRCSTQTRKNFDAKKLEKEHQELDLSAYYKQKTFKKLDVKGA